MSVLVWLGGCKDTVTKEQEVCKRVQVCRNVQRDQIPNVQINVLLWLGKRQDRVSQVWSVKWYVLVHRNGVYAEPEPRGLRV